MTRHLLVLGLVCTVAACGTATQAPRPVAGEWLEFEGSWNGVGDRRTIALGEARAGSIVNLKGTLLLAGRAGREWGSTPR